MCEGGKSSKYDAEGNRVKKTTSAGTIYFLVDDQNPTGYSQVVETRTLSGSTWTVQNRWVYGIMAISQSDSGGLKWYYGYDGHNNVRFLVNPSGAKAATYNYDAYGIDLNSTGPTVDSNPLRYCGEQWDPDLGLYFLRARYYNPALGRFTGFDSFEGVSEEPASLHRYLYCQANPINLEDPSGKFSMGEISIVTATVFFLSTLQLEPMLKQGGPDVTAALALTLADVEKAYWKMSVKQKLISFTTLYDAFNMMNSNIGAENAWDINFLHYRGASRSEKLEDRTVTLRGKVYYASAVNYMLWGKMHALHDKQFGTFTLPHAVAVAGVRKAAITHGIVGLEEQQAIGFTRYGYFGNPLPAPISNARAGSRKINILLPWTWQPYHP